jgi:DNA-binding response OmpR family regulator
MPPKIKLLIVDDEMRFLQTLGERLELRGFDVTTASDGDQALRTARRERFDLALVDLKMPGLDGDRVLELLRAEDPLIEVIVLTGHGSFQSRVDCVRAGSHSYLHKPCETETLLVALQDAYRARRRRERGIRPVDDDAREEGT